MNEIIQEQERLQKLTLSKTPKHFILETKREEYSFKKAKPLQGKPDISTTQKCTPRKNSSYSKDTSPDGENPVKRNSSSRGGCPEFRLKGSSSSMHKWRKIENEMRIIREEAERKAQERRLLEYQEELKLYQDHHASDTFKKLLSVMSDEGQARKYGGSEVSLVSHSTFSEDSSPLLEVPNTDLINKPEDTEYGVVRKTLVPIVHAVEEPEPSPLPIVIQELSKTKRTIRRKERHRKCVNDRDLKPIVEEDEDEPESTGSTLKGKSTVSFFGLKTVVGKKLQQQESNEEITIFGGEKPDPVVPDVVKASFHRPSEEFESCKDSTESVPSKYGKYVDPFTPSGSDIYDRSDESHVTLTEAVSVQSYLSGFADWEDKKRNVKIRDIVKTEKHKVKEWIHQNEQKHTQADDTPDPCASRGMQCIIHKFLRTNKAISKLVCL